MSVNGGAAALGGVFSDALVQGPCSGAHVELPAGDAGELVNTVSHEALGGIFGEAGGSSALPYLGLAGSHDVQDGVGASVNADVDVLPLK